MPTFWSASFIPCLLAFSTQLSKCLVCESVLFLGVSCEMVYEFLCCVLDYTGNAINLILNLSYIAACLANKEFQSLFQCFLVHELFSSPNSLGPINYNPVRIMLCLCCHTQKNFADIERCLCHNHRVSSIAQCMRMLQY